MLERCKEVVKWVDARQSEAVWTRESSCSEVVLAIKAARLVRVMRQFDSVSASGVHWRTS